MENEDIAYRQQVVEKYKPDIQKLLRYLPWLEEKAGQNVCETFDGSGIRGSSIPFPVYDGTLMSFLKEAQRTKLLDRNYVYVYSKYRIRTIQDELKIIEETDITQMNILTAILSKYVMGGMTKAVLWTEAVQYGVFAKVVKKMWDNVEFWDDKPKE